jgi:uronate dehydrogenase
VSTGEQAATDTSASGLGGRTVLVTGSAGLVGATVCAGLAELGWQVRGYDVQPTPNVEAVVADIRDEAALSAALRGTYAVVHLAAIPTEVPFPAILESNVDGTYRVVEGTRRAGVARLVFASSNHAVGFTPRMPMAGVELPPRPDTYYGLSKVFGEALCRLYADRYGLQVACLRIGSFVHRPTEPRHLVTWLSPGDAVRLVHACLSTPRLDFAIVWGVSANTRGWWDLAPGRVLGYQPRDDAEAYAEQILGGGELGPDDPRLALLGGEFTGPEYDVDRLAGR